MGRRVVRGLLRYLRKGRDVQAMLSAATPVMGPGLTHRREALTRIATGPPAPGPERWTVTCKDRRAVRAALAQLHGTDVYVEAILPERPSLEQRFLHHACNGSGGD